MDEQMRALMAVTAILRDQLPSVDWNVQMGKSTGRQLRITRSYVRGTDPGALPIPSYIEIEDGDVTIELPGHVDPNGEAQRTWYELYQEALNSYRFS